MRRRFYELYIKKEGKQLLKTGEKKRIQSDICSERKQSNCRGTMKSEKESKRRRKDQR